MNRLEIKSKNREEMIDITQEIRTILQISGIEKGVVHLFVPHTTAAVTINENADPAVTADLLLSLKKISPVYREFKHSEGNSDAHVKSSLIGNDQQIFVENGKLVLGTWQGIYFCEFDGPRNRNLFVKIVSC